MNSVAVGTGAMFCRPATDDMMARDYERVGKSIDLIREGYVLVQWRASSSGEMRDDGQG